MQVQLDDLRTVATTYAEEVEAARGDKDRKMPDMLRDLETHISKMNEQLVQLSATLEEGIFEQAAHFATPELVQAELEKVAAKLETLEATAAQYNQYQTTFGLTSHAFKSLRNTQEQFQAIGGLWNTVVRWNTACSEWMDGSLSKLDAEAMARDLQTFSRDAFSAHKHINTEITGCLRESTAELSTKMPLILDLGNPAMRPRHFEQLFEALGQPYSPDDDFSLSNLISWGVLSQSDLVSTLSGMASGEAGLEAALREISSSWETMQLNVIPYSVASTETFILSELEDILALLDDNMVSLSTMMASRFIQGVRDDVERWQQRLNRLSDTLEAWVACQKAWMYLETIFSAEDIQKQLPDESSAFQAVDGLWKSAMSETHEDPSILGCLDADRLPAFRQANEDLEGIQKRLEEYLETKRAAFPRFYFLSNDELLEILSQTRDPKAVQPHMSKCFDAIKKIHFDEGAGGIVNVVAFEDPGGEVINFTTEPVAATGPVEYWLGGVEDSMRLSLQKRTADCREAYPIKNPVERKAWLFCGFPAQSVIVVDEIFWTHAGETALRSDDPTTAMSKFFQESLDQIDAMIDLIRTPITRQQRTLLGALITIDVHSRDVVRALRADSVSSTADFGWTKQLRYYWDSDRELCMCRQTNTNFEYGYEYIGNGPRLVITPLTDLCYMTLTGALHMKLGGAPAGPAGTGKTETTKDLAKALAVYCVVFNCSDGLDYRIMGRFFSGLAQQGAWACFDEFNRIDIEVLSVIAQQVLSIQQALALGATSLNFEGAQLRLRPSFGVFITMNPGYAGRTELPDNLKALFRPVAMMVPDYRLIAEIVLFSEGFAHALPLSNKMAQLYTLASEQLSKQGHYDFGMRAVKSVLVAAGALKRRHPDENEELLLIRAMRDSNVPKFLRQDVPLFQGILLDLFPGVNVPYVDYGALQTAIESALQCKSLQASPSFVTKVIQVHETQLIRHGVMVVGEAGAGKSLAVSTLASALATLADDKVHDPDGFYRHVDTFCLNPKTSHSLYGEFSQLTGEWTDGLVPQIVRNIVGQVDDGRRKWMIFDGPVDAVWIEDMNTVLDDNKTLCLSNSERIRLPTSLHMMFEVQDLAAASPATVSRCGMVYMEMADVGLLSLVRTWCQVVLPHLLPDAVSWCLVELIEKHLEGGIELLRETCTEVIPTTDGQLTTSLLNLLQSMLLMFGQSGNSPASDGAPEFTSTSLRLLFAWCFMWSIGAAADDKSRPKLEEKLRDRFRTLVGSGSPFLQDMYGMGLTSAHDFRTWDAMANDSSFSVDLASVPFSSILVPTADTVRHSYVMSALLNGGHGVLLAGGTGVGKSAVVKQSLADMKAGGQWTHVIHNCSARTSPSDMKAVLVGTLEKRRRTGLAPPAGKRMAFFVDDINMPAVEQYGAQPPNELLRQVIDSGGFYDEVHQFRKIEDVVLVAAAAPPGGGRSALSPRLLRHLCCIWLESPSHSSLSRIFEGILGSFLAPGTTATTMQPSTLVSASIELYERIAAELLPTPAKSHYTFNLRDLSKVFQGILMARAESLDDEGLLKLWAHESSRVFRDRLICTADQDWFDTAVCRALSRDFHREWAPETFNSNIFLFTEREGAELYTMMPSVTATASVFEEHLERYNMNFPSAEMHLAFFADAVSHVSRICRLLRQPRGSALLVGVGGSGRQSLTRLASFVCGYRCAMVEITKNYGSEAFRNDLKAVMLDAGCDDLPVSFLFSDAQIVEESFLEDINNILSSGDIPNLYAPEDVERIISSCRGLTKEGEQTHQDIMAAFTERLRDNLHIVLCMSPIGTLFRERCRMFPALINCCTIDWYALWPKEALLGVARRSLDAGDDNLCQAAVGIHMSVKSYTEKMRTELGRQSYATPTSYLELLRLYKDGLDVRRRALNEDALRYTQGLTKLQQTKETVEELREELTRIQPQLAIAAADAEQLIVKVTADQAEADVQAASVSEDVAVADAKSQSVQVIKDDCQADLDEAMPAYYASIKALDSLDKKDIQEMKSFANPPQMVAYTMEAVSILMLGSSHKPTWDASKKLLGRLTLLDDLKAYDKDNIPPKTIRALKSYVDNEMFSPDEVAKVSSAAKSLCMWARAMVTYDRVAKSIEPKKEALANAQAELAEVMKELEGKRSALAKVQADVAELRAKLEATELQREELEAQAQTTRDRLGRAEELMGGLGGQAVQWQESAARLQAALATVSGDMLLASAALAYMGPFPSEIRRAMGEGWLDVCSKAHVPVGSQFSLTNILADPVELREWQLQGLPADDFSSENALLATRGRRWPLMIDPQGQANRWVRALCGSGLSTTKLSDKDMLRTLENGVRYGTPVLLENVGEELDPALEPLLLKQIFRKGGQDLLRIGDVDVPYSPDFRLYITTKLANPHYLPEVCIRVTVINFTVTVSGLEDQLLVDVVKSERPDLEAKRDELVVSIANDKRGLADVEGKILRMLAASSGNILDDHELIAALSESRQASAAIEIRLHEAEITSSEISSTRELYRTVAARGSMLYFVCASLAEVDHMYQYALPYFQTLFCQRLHESEKRKVLEERLEVLVDDITRSVFRNVCRGLFESHKLLFAFMISAKIMQASGAVSDAEWRIFLSGGAAVSPEAQLSRPDWLSKRGWHRLGGLACDLSDGPFAQLPGSISRDPSLWEAFFSDGKDMAFLPLPVRLTPFQRLLALRAAREEKTVEGIKSLVAASLDPSYVESPPFDLAGAFMESSKTTPLIFILSPGADVNDSLLQLGAERNMTQANGRLRIISLGQGQGVIAERMMQEGASSGAWVCLQNCHLAASWLPRLEHLLENIEPSEVHADYRLWLTSSPSPKFPVAVLQGGLKLTNEPPKGLRANLLRTLADLRPEDYDVSPKVKRLLFATAFFNAIVLERRKFGAVGWNIPYQWMGSDLKAAMNQVRMYVEEQDEIPWDTINVMVSDVTYGGRVTDMWDKRALRAIMAHYFQEDLLQEENFRFSSGPEYPAMAADGDIQEVVENVRNFPGRDAPQTFHLHPNADISFERKESRDLTDLVIVMSGGRASGATGGSSGTDEFVLKTAASIEARLPPGPFNLKDAHPSVFAAAQNGGINSLGIFVGQELARFNTLSGVMRSTLAQLQQAVHGTVVMSSSLERMYDGFLLQRIPVEWETAGYPCLKPLASWVDDHCARLAFLDDWLKKGPPNSFWLSGFFFPQGFMTAVKQTYARSHLVAIDTLSVGCEMTRMLPEDLMGPPPGDVGVYIHGICMEGARFDIETMQMAESLPGELLSPVRCIWLKPCIAGEQGKGRDSEYMCPIYKTPLRFGTLSTTGHSTNFVVALPVPTPKSCSPDMWSRRGAAMLLTSDQ
jgi:dynein heavy chain